MSEYDNNQEYEEVCFICHRPESKAGRMFKLPNHICVGDDCMHKTMDAMSQYDYGNIPGMDMSGMNGAFMNNPFLNNPYMNNPVGGSSMNPSAAE